MARNGTLGSFEELVLLALARCGEDAYGMNVRRELAEHSGREVAIGAVYSTLDRMEAKGLVTSRMSAPDTDRRGGARRHFRMEPAGIHALLEARKVRDQLADGLDLEELSLKRS